MLGIISLLLVLYFLLFITRIASIILVYTGLSREVARFQSRSAVTGCGFTTAESEEITGNIIRRRVVSTLMLVGNVGIIASISSLLLSMVTVDRESDYRFELLYRFGLLAAGLLALWYCSKQRWFETMTMKIFEFVTRGSMKLAARRFNTLCHLSNDFRISEVYVAEGSPLAGKSAAESAGLLGETRLLAVQRAVKDYISDPPPDFRFQRGDALILYGSGDAIEQVIERGEMLPGRPRKKIQ